MAYALFYLLSLLFTLPILALAQTKGTIAVGSSLIANNNVTTPWLSPSGDFAFGFQQIQGNGLFILSIWYEKIPDKTIAWFANATAQVPRGSRVELTNQGLVLNDPQGTLLWNSSGLTRNQVSYGVMNDTGNFELVQSDSFRIWSTFQHPSDTMLPTQIMERDGVLYPRMSQTNFSRGRFKFIFQRDGNLVSYTQNAQYNLVYDAYYASATNDLSNSSKGGQQLIFNETGYLYILKENGKRLDLTGRMERQAQDYYFRVTFNFDGVFTQYYHPRNFTGKPGWTALWWGPGNICLSVNGSEGSGVCGFNSICKLQDQGRPSCECPQGYSLLDPNDLYSSCKPNFTQSCEDDVPTSSGESLYDFKELTGTDWPTSAYEHMGTIREEHCRSSCTTDCFCAVAIYQGTSCLKKKLPLSTYVQSFPQIQKR